MTMSLTAGGIAGTRWCGDSGTFDRCAATISSSGRSANGSVPVNSSYSVTPSEYRSDRASQPSLVRPVCSGEMYAGVPTMSPTGSARALTGSSAAMPKSPSAIASLAASYRMLTGLMSRCTTRAACTRSHARASCSATRSARATGNGPSRSASARLPEPNRRWTSTGPSLPSNTPNASTTPGPATFSSTRYSWVRLRRPWPTSLATTGAPSDSRIPPYTSVAEPSYSSVSRKTQRPSRLVIRPNSPRT